MKIPAKIFEDTIQTFATTIIRATIHAISSVDFNIITSAATRTDHAARTPNLDTSGREYNSRSTPFNLQTASGRPY
jgi:hypothetical protein